MQGYNLLACHSKWDHEEISNLMGSGTVFITIFRNPVDQFVSCYQYFNLQNTYKMTLREFIAEVASKKKNVPWDHGFRGRNSHLVDLGMEPLDTLDKDKVIAKI